MLVPKDTFSVRVQASGDEARLRLAGRFDASALRVFENAVAQILDRDVVLDLDGVSFMDGAAWVAVMAHERRATAAGHRLRVINAPGRIRTLFEVTETEHLLSRSAATG